MLWVYHYALRTRAILRKGFSFHRMKLKRILAILGILVLAGMYLASLIFAIIDHPLKTSLLSASLYATIVIPVLLYVFLFVAKLLRGDPDKQDGGARPDKKNRP